jgi:hypothetical protein
MSSGVDSKSHGCNFLIKVADLYEKEKIMKMMVKENRQTMNLRLMPTAKLLLIQDKDKNFLTA